MAVKENIKRVEKVKVNQFMPGLLSIPKDPIAFETINAVMKDPKSDTAIEKMNSPFNLSYLLVNSSIGASLTNNVSTPKMQKFSSK